MHDNLFVDLCFEVQYLPLKCNGAAVETVIKYSNNVQAP